MANLRDLERGLPAFGLSASRLDTILRKLREDEYLAIEGRGLNARQVDAQDAALILIAYLGSHKATKASDRLAKLRQIRNADDVTLGVRVRQLIEDSSTLSFAIISRTHQRAWLHMIDGGVEEFKPKLSKSIEGRLQVSGTVDALVLSGIRRLLSGDFVVNSEEVEPEDSE